MRGGIRLYFYPRPPRGGRPGKIRREDRALRISIHALREEGDPRATSSRRCWCDFYPRPPRGGRPRSRSSHAAPRYFYPRPPRGGRRNTSYQRAMADIFLSTPSARRATPSTSSVRHSRFNFYPRPPRGGRPPQRQQLTEHGRFLSTPSARRATTEREVKTMKHTYISIHALREEGDTKTASR